MPVLKKSKVLMGQCFNTSQGVYYTLGDSGMLGMQGKAHKVCSPDTGKEEAAVVGPAHIARPCLGRGARQR